MTLGEWLTKWVEEYKAPMIRESTAARYRHMINNHIIPNLGSKIITQVATQDIQKMYNKLKRSGRMEKHKVHGHELSNSMVRAIHMMLHEALDGAVREGLIPVNPTEGTTIPKLGRQEKTVLLQSQIETFLRHLEGDEIWYDFFYTDLIILKNLPKYKSGKMSISQLLDFEHKDRVIPIFIIEQLLNEKDKYQDERSFTKIMATILNCGERYGVTKDKLKEILGRYLAMDQEGTFAVMLESAIEYFKNRFVNHK